MTKSISVLLLALILGSGCGSSSKKDEAKATEEKQLTVILETDMGNDIDDALAIDMLYKYMDASTINLIGVSVNKDNEYAAQFIDLMNTWYGYPSIPIGRVKDGIEDTVPSNFGQKTCEYKLKDGSFFAKSIADYNTLLESTAFYRKLLSEQADSSVVIISVGFFTNLARLLDSPADSYSPLIGKELVAQKVKLLSLMGGNFDGTNPHEYNVVKDIKSAQKVFDEWPNEIVVSPFEVGVAILFPGEVIEKKLSFADEHPLAVAYKSYLPMPYDRPTWDLTSVLYAVEGQNNYFGLSQAGQITVDSLGGTTYKVVDTGKHIYLTVDKEQTTKIKNRFIDLIGKTPKSLKSN